MQVVFPARNRTFGAIDLVGAVGLVGLLIARFVPVARIIPFWGCTFRTFTGIPCPGCGLTRVADRFAHFHFLRALEANPLGTLVAAFFALAIVLSFIHLVFAVPMPEFILSEKEWTRVRWISIGALVLNYAFVVITYRYFGFR